MTAQSLTQMAGTTGTGVYTVIARGAYGRVGVRLLPGSYPGSNLVRVRVEPRDDENAETMKGQLEGWKHPFGDPDGNVFRFSKVVPMGPSAVEIVEMGLDAIRRIKLRWNTRDWVKLVS